MGRSDGWYHGRVTLMLTPLAAVAGAFAGHGIAGDALSGAVIAGAGCLSGLIVDPDLDQVSITSSEGRVLRLARKIPVVGHLAAGAWIGWWMIYAMLHKHRGISHVPILGTAGRVIFLAIPVSLVVVLAGGSPLSLFRWETLMWACGLALSDLGHYVYDCRHEWIPSRKTKKRLHLRDTGSHGRRGNRFVETARGRAGAVKSVGAGK